ncbi:hypothetical protein NDU88_007501 [Pleurodeles waltl]|uniref:Uncharacterized protein n=1 Tax=Pleurodeles waltl TaxID=8319 RepID=A0AAV7QKZ6_PLEWA|nr:hypothetical protein NDU88_007501 [Pleurodeles waltl]
METLGKSVFSLTGPVLGSPPRSCYRCVTADLLPFCDGNETRSPGAGDKPVEWIRGVVSPAAAARVLSPTQGRPTARKTQVTAKEADDFRNATVCKTEPALK